MKLLSERIGDYVGELWSRPAPLWAPYTDNHYLVSWHEAMPMLVGFRYVGGNREHAERLFQYSLDKDRASIEADRDCVA